ncbi:outer membrane protein assembly factor BamD [Chakrabartia godavariana]|nr:outer membrane protein assembly factor BamD [Chakrabartia godavariana]
MRHALISIALLSAVATAPLAAQDNSVDLRVGKLEKEMKAVQRKVFPGGVPVQPEIGPLDTGDAGAAPASTPLTDLTSRVDALEAQLKMLTGQAEMDGNRLKKLEDAFKAYQTATDARLKALEPPVPAVVATDDAAAAVPAKPAALAPAPAPALAPAKEAPKPLAAKPKVDAPAAAATTKPTVPAKNDPKRKALVDAVEIPATGDAAEDAYTYGFRLWTAKLYPEAQVKLKEFAAKYPKHKRASYAQNLLGRAYLDEGKPALASVAFYDNYTKNPKGERASESLYFLGVALTRLKKLPDACKVFDEFKDVYGASAPGDLKARVAKARTDASCPA